MVKPECEEEKEFLDNAAATYPQGDGSYKVNCRLIQHIPGVCGGSIPADGGLNPSFVELVR
ncbi:MAG: hypothetical protein ACPLTR_05965, partial [Thermacetogeniaceae bacterium]